MKKLSILALVASIAMITGVAMANIPAPPVEQSIGFDDTDFNNMELADCLVCHSGGTADMHHMLYGSAMPDGVCSATTGFCSEDGTTECGSDTDCTGTCDKTPRDCYTDADCVTGINICSNSGDSCTDALDCPRQYQHPTCDNTPYCSGTSAAANVPGSQDNGGVYGCLTCHYEDTSSGVIVFVVERDCTVCHVQLPNSPTVHHLDEDQDMAKAGLCVVCHGDIVDDMADGHYIPAYDPSLVTPGSVTTERICTETGWGPVVVCTVDADCAAVSPTSVCDENLHKSETAEAGSCDFCHDAGTDTASGVDVINNHDTHHGTGVYKDRYGNTVDPLDIGGTACDWCHYLGNPHNAGALDPVEIRTCEGCHGPDSLHNIQVDTNGGGVVAGGEDAGYGHIGKDDPGVESDCWGCHGFSVAAEMTPGSGVPSIYSAAPKAMTAGADTAVAITGAAFLNGDIGVRLTDAAGNAVALDAADVTDGSLTVTVNTAAGIYNLQVVKDGEASNAIGIAVVPAVAITDMDCSKCLSTMTISGVNFAVKPDGTDEDISVTEDGRPLNVINWSDTEITVSGARCRGDVVVNGIYGSSE